MTGLAGIVDPQASHEELETSLSRMLHALQAEPWYESLGQVLDCVALGQARLGILSGSPPVSTQDGALWAVLDGEIYSPSHHPLKRDLVERGHRLQSDNDVVLLLHLFKEHGEDFILDINGSFNFVIWDGRERKLLIFTDRFGSRPFYYCRTGTAFSFASEIKALLQDRRLKREVNEEAIAEFMTFRHILGAKTPIVGIHYLAPSSILTYQNGQVTLRSYWMPDFEKQKDRLPFADYAAQLTYLLRQAVDRCMSKGQSTGLYLSGGVDSRLLTGLVDHRYFPFHTFTRGTPGCHDARLGQKVSDQIGSTHHFVEIPPDYLIHRAKRGVWLTDGLMTCVDFYVLSNIEKVREHVDVVWFGLMSAGLSGMRSTGAVLGLDDRQLAQKIYAMRAVYVQDGMQPQLFTEQFHQRVKGVALRNVQQIVRDIPLEGSDLKTQFYLLRYYIPRAGMGGPALARSLVETRFPFVDADVLDFVYTIPTELTEGRKMEIEVLRRVNPELARIPWQFTGLPVLSSTPMRTRFRRGLLRARKELSWRTYGLIPPPRGREQADYAVWFHTILRSWLEGILLSERTLSREYYRPEGIQRLIQEHMSGRRDRTLQFGVLLTFELWNQLFVDGESL
jgi:asparagine synthase (glutamine-hydrolysing)